MVCEDQTRVYIEMHNIEERSSIYGMVRVEKSYRCRTCKGSDISSDNTILECRTCTLVAPLSCGQDREQENRECQSKKTKTGVTGQCRDFAYELWMYNKDRVWSAHLGTGDCSIKCWIRCECDSKYQRGSVHGVHDGEERRETREISTDKESV